MKEKHKDRNTMYKDRQIEIYAYAGTSEGTIILRIRCTLQSRTGGVTGAVPSAPV